MRHNDSKKRISLEQNSMLEEGKKPLKLHFYTIYRRGTDEEKYY